MFDKKRADLDCFSTDLNLKPCRSTCETLQINAVGVLVYYLTDYICTSIYLNNFKLSANKQYGHVSIGTVSLFFYHQHYR